MPRPPIHNERMTPNERKQEERKRRKVLGHQQWWLTPQEQRLIIDYRIENPPELQALEQPLLLPPEYALGTRYES